MNLGIKYQGKIATTDDVEFINKLIAENPNDSRRALSKKLCEANEFLLKPGEVIESSMRLKDAHNLRTPYFVFFYRVFPMFDFVGSEALISPRRYECLLAKTD
jgi:hypothetical protein